jgi:hypothetical protein
MQMFLEEKPHLQPLPLQGFRFFCQETRTVDDAGLVQVGGSYYAALPAPLYSEVTVRIYELEIEILDQQGQLLRRHEKSADKGEFIMAKEDRIFNPSRETARLIAKATKIGPHCMQLAREIFARLGRPGQKAIYGLANLARHHKREDIERACQKVLSSASWSTPPRLKRQALPPTSLCPNSRANTSAESRSTRRFGMSIANTRLPHPTQTIPRPPTIHRRR